jgi:hypothetical protein
MKKYYTLLFGLIIGALPYPALATVCGVIPDSYELALDIIELTIGVLFLAVIANCVWYLHTYFTEKELGWSGRYFWWLLGGFILAVVIGILVYLDAPKACGLGPYVDIPII